MFTINGFEWSCGSATNKYVIDAGVGEMAVLRRKRV
jgi:hypothetical protein